MFGRKPVADKPEMRYLQACEVGGSIYGKKKAGGENIVLSKESKGHRTHSSMISAYNALYKKQAYTISKIIQRSY